MKNFTQIAVIGIIVLCAVSISTAIKNTGPVLAEKLEAPEQIVKQTLQKRALIWIDGQWKIEKTINTSGSADTGKQKKLATYLLMANGSKHLKDGCGKKDIGKKIDFNKWMSLLCLINN